ncbi:3-octaprenyl-4-hydroxybenzoate decarboxylase, partial [Chloroflexota bacterium]
MSKKDVTSVRGALEYLESQGQVIRIKQEVDPIYEIAGIQKALEGGPVLLFENIKGYPDFYDIGNLFGTRENVADLFDF